MIKYVVIIAAVAGIYSVMPAGAEEAGVGIGPVGVTKIVPGTGIVTPSATVIITTSTKPSSLKTAITTEMLTMIAGAVLSIDNSRISTAPLWGPPFCVCDSYRRVPSFQMEGLRATSVSLNQRGRNDALSLVKNFQRSARLFGTI
jgi:hypothetical protein